MFNGQFYTLDIPSLSNVNYFPCCLLHIECPLLPSELEHGTINGSGHVEGSMYRFRCADGYSIVGQDILYCTKMGWWNASIPTCLRGNNSAISEV